MKQIQLRHESDKWVKRVADMVYKEFVAASGSGMPYEDVFSFFSNAHSETLPVTFIAILMTNARERFRHLNMTAKNGPSTSPGWHRFLSNRPAAAWASAKH
ncbi:hypothetical protein MKY40_19325 [Bacillus sp. FSL M8-0168]|uniref:hypothetical protein n=1 Tax=Bacillus sp. FSL M8-0168 TaxID=2921614 RepID=UPI0030FDAA67